MELLLSISAGFPEALWEQFQSSVEVLHQHRPDVSVYFWPSCPEGPRRSPSVSVGCPAGGLCCLFQGRLFVCADGPCAPAGEWHPSAEAAVCWGSRKRPVGQQHTTGHPQQRDASRRTGYVFPLAVCGEPQGGSGFVWIGVVHCFGLQGRLQINLVLVCFWAELGPTTFL